MPSIDYEDVKRMAQSFNNRINFLSEALWMLRITDCWCDHDVTGVHSQPCLQAGQAIRTSSNHATVPPPPAVMGGMIMEEPPIDKKRRRRVSKEAFKLDLK